MNYSLLVYVMIQITWMAAYGLLLLRYLKLKKEMKHWRPFIRATREVEERVMQAMMEARRMPSDLEVDPDSIKVYTNGSNEIQ